MIAVLPFLPEEIKFMCGIVALFVLKGIITESQLKRAVLVTVIQQQPDVKQRESGIRLEAPESPAPLFFLFKNSSI